MNKVVMQRIYRDGCMKKHTGKKELTFDKPVYTMFKQNDMKYTIVADYGNGLYGNWICDNARQALTCFRIMIGIM